MENERSKLVLISRKYSPKSFINYSDELIIVPKNNIYIPLKINGDSQEWKREVISWLSRPSCKGISYYWQKRVRAIVNEFLGTNFSATEMSDIYTRLGNGCNKELCYRFIESDYDLSVLK